MNPFDYVRASNTVSAIMLGSEPETKFLGGGTNLVDLMRQTVERPSKLVDVTGLGAFIKESGNGGVIIGGATKNSAVAGSQIIRERYPMLSRAILSGASAQIRNLATVAGNMLQRTRCAYFYDTVGSRCNKRELGLGCDALEGFNRNHAILGASAACVATHPSDMCVALAALDAEVHIARSGGTRTLPFTDLHQLPGTNPHIDTQIEAGELITAIQLPMLHTASRSTYRKVRDRASYAFALVSVAAVLQIEDERIVDVRLALGGVAHKPWRATKAEAMLKGRAATTDAFCMAVEEELTDATPLRENHFKIALTKRTIVSVLVELARRSA